MNKKQRFVAQLLLGTSVLGCQGCTAAVLVGGGLVGYGMHLSHEERRELHQINQERSEAGLKPLTAEQYKKGLEPGADEAQDK